MKKRIAILGSTGSIGTQALEVIKQHPDYFSAEIITAQKNAELLIQQAIEYKPDSVVISDEQQYKKVQEGLRSYNIKVYTGNDALSQITELDNIDIVLTAVVGFAGLKPTLKAIGAGKHIALANKETLVVAGKLITDAAKEKGVNIYPVDSEHSAIFQCIAGEFQNPIEKIYLTASGGAFREKTEEELKYVTKDDALKHPNWNMGAKVTIDSATLMNKGLEVIEAYWLFGLKPEQIDVIVHPQSIIHSIVQFADGSMKAQMSLPDMKLPIQYALGYPYRLKSNSPRLNLLECKQLTFEPADTNKFRCLSLAYEALNKGGNMPCIMNAANEIVVENFLKENLTFLKIPDIIEQCMQKIKYLKNPSVEDYIATDKETRLFTQSII